MVMGGHLLHPELTADLSGAARAHSLQEMLILMKLLDASCLKPGPVPSSLCSARFSSKKVHPSLIWTILTMLLLVLNITIVTVITDNDRAI